MKKQPIDASMRGILLLSIVMAICMGAFMFLSATVVPQEDRQAVTILDIDQQSMRLYAQTQKQTGIPWVLLCAVDRAEDSLPSIVGVQELADIFVQAGAIERGLTIGPITNAADLAGLYTTDRKGIERIAREMLSLEDLYLLIESGRFPADGGTIIDGEEGCRIIGVTQAHSPFAGTVTKAAGGVVDIDCDNGLFVHIAGIESISAAQGNAVLAGSVIGETTSFVISFSYGNRCVHPYPYLLLFSDV